MPGVNDILESESAPASSPAETGKLFAVGATERGSTAEPITVHSPQEFKNKCGPAVAGSYLATSVEEFFAEGGSTALIGRALGSAAASSTTTLLGSAAGASLVITAANPGSWGNKLEAQVTAAEEAGRFNILIKESGTLVESYTNLANRVAAVEANEARRTTGANPVVLIAFGTEVDNPVVAAAKALSGGSEPAVTNTHLINALNLFGEELGVGQVAAPGISAQTVQEALMAHGEKFNRTPLLDFPVQGAAETLAEYEATLLAARTSLKNKEGGRRSACFSSWARIPGRAPNTTVLCPYSAVQAGILARNDASATPPPVNKASAGEEGQTRNVTNLVSAFKRPERDKLNENGITPVRLMPTGAIETYGVPTLANSETDPAWVQLTASRLFMLVEVECNGILEKAVLKQIDPHNLLFNKVGAEIEAFLVKLGNQLFNNPAEAVNVGPTVNTAETIRKREVVASVKIKPTKAAEVVTLRLSAQA